MISLTIPLSQHDAIIIREHLMRLSHQNKQTILQKDHYYTTTDKKEVSLSLSTRTINEQEIYYITYHNTEQIQTKRYLSINSYQEGKDIIEELGFIPGTHKIQYYLYYSRQQTIFLLTTKKKNHLIIQDNSLEQINKRIKILGLQYYKQ